MSTPRVTPQIAPSQTAKLQQLSVIFKFIFKDGREFTQDVDLVFEHESQISSAIDRAFARFWTYGYTERLLVEEKLINYGPQHFDRIEMTQARIQKPVLESL